MVQIDVGHDGKRKVLCICDCGRKKTVTARYLREKKTRSCGCLYKETRQNRKRYFTDDDKRKALKRNTYKTRKKNRKKYREYNRKYSRNLIKELSDTYLKRLFYDSGIKYKYITPEMIEERRHLIKFKRELKKIKETANEFFGDQS